jgi:acyl-coenzyme A synthetase/AMP-(fatty) acid ligase
MLRAVGPREALHLISVYGADALVASSQQLRDVVGQQSQAPVPCPTLRTIMTGGGLISHNLMSEARAKLCSTIVIQYGSSEAGSTAYALADQIDGVEGATGYVVPGAEVQVIDENGKPLPADTEGVLRVRAPWLAQAFSREAASAQSDIRDGWFYPGDRGRLRADGLLIITGRTSEVINAGGLKLAPEVIEEIVLDHPNIAEAAAFGTMASSGIEDIYIAVVSRAPLDEQQLINWCGERNIPVARVFTLDSLPKSDNGKIQRGELKRRLLP